jgi:hypothetical protein
MQTPQKGKESLAKPKETVRVERNKRLVAYGGRDM